MAEPSLAERQGFEPWKGEHPLTVFKTAAFNRSATSPEKTCDRFRDAAHSIPAHENKATT